MGVQQPQLRSAQAVLLHALSSESIIQALQSGPCKWITVHRILRATIDQTPPQDQDVLDLCGWLSKVL